MPLPSWLPWVSLIISILSFFWVGSRREAKDFIDRYRASPSALAGAMILFWLLLPYIVGASTIFGLFYMSLYHPPIQVHHHTLREIKVKGGDAVAVDAYPQIEVRSPNEHFEISVKGEIYGPELNELKERFGSLKETHMYIVVEENRHGTKGLYWVQKGEGGSLDSRGAYDIRAYLGGKGPAKAVDGELFLIRIYIPDRGVKFKDHAVYKIAELPKPLFLSNPFYIRTRRPPEHEGASASSVPEALPHKPSGNEAPVNQP